MVSAFEKPNSAAFGDKDQKPSFIREFWFKDGMQLPLQVLNPPVDLFPNGFPVIRRHWAQKPVYDKDGNPVMKNGKQEMKWLRPQICTEGHDATDGHCLICYAKEQNLLTADRGAKTPNEEMIIPVYEHTLYRKNGDRYEPVPPGMPIVDGNQNQMFEGGLKIIYVGDSQFRKLRTQNDNVANICADCGNRMQMESLNCRHCDSPLYEQSDLAMLSNEDLENLRFKPTECAVCQEEDTLELVRVCSNCGSNRPKTLHDIVIMAGRNSVPTNNGRTRKEYVFSEAAGYEPKQVDQEELSDFWQKLRDMLDNPPSIARQHEIVGIQPPQAWLKKSSGSAPSQPTQQ